METGFARIPLLTEVLPEPGTPWTPAVRSAVTQLEARAKDLLNHNPLESLLALVVGGAALYYAAERGRNDKVLTFWDALEYVSTCASVGYSNIFPATPLGKIVASVLFVLGPSLAAKALDQRESLSGTPALPPGQQAILARLDEILAELRRGKGDSNR